jgi:hypothetical protein
MSSSALTVLVVDSFLFEIQRLVIVKRADTIDIPRDPILLLQRLRDIVRGKIAIQVQSRQFS